MAEQPSRPSVRPATADDVPAVATTLAHAFADHPWTSWTVDARDRDRRLVELYALFAGIALRTGELWVTDDVAAAAAWQPPTDEGTGGAEPPDPRVFDLLGDRLDAAAEAEALLDERRPTAPHWYLATVGTRPERQGEGLGPRVLAPVLARADADGVGAACETSVERNLAFYARLGFAVTDELVLPGGGPPVWFLWRPPAA